MPRKVSKRKDAELAVVGSRQPPVVMNGGRTIRTLSAKYIGDLQDHWEKNGISALDEYRMKHVARYVENCAMRGAGDPARGRYQAYHQRADDDPRGAR
jgi:hypothetical protein